MQRATAFFLATSVFDGAHCALVHKEAVHSTILRWKAKQAILPPSCGRLRHIAL